MIIVGTVGYIIVVASGYHLFKANLITIGTVYLLIQYITLLLGPLRQLIDQIADLQKATASINRVEHLFNTQSAIQNGRLTLPSGALSLQFKNVSFFYSTGEYILRDVSFHIEAGEVLGVMGRTGVGKTTLARLVLRLCENEKGNILVGNVDIRDVELRNLRQRVKMLPQDVQLFHASIRENLRLYDPSITDDQLLDLIQDMRLEPWLSSLPAGLDTIVDPKDAGMSAGQAQLMGVTRVFIGAPGLIILDEPTSCLDLGTEYLIEESITRLRDDCACLLITHRLETIKLADRILLLEDGKAARFVEARGLGSFTEYLGATEGHAE